MPLDVLQEAQQALINLSDTGIGILEHSHRGKAFLAVYEETEALCRELDFRRPSSGNVLFSRKGCIERSDATGLRNVGWPDTVCVLTLHE